MTRKVKGERVSAASSESASPTDAPAEPSSTKPEAVPVVEVQHLAHKRALMSELKDSFLNHEIDAMTYTRKARALEKEIKELELC